MARIAATGFWSHIRARADRAWCCLGRRSWLVAGLSLLSAVFSDTCYADPVKGEATFSANGGYARLVIKLDEDVDSQVTVAGSIIIVRFRRPVEVPVEKLGVAVPDYVGSARIDPDGYAMRLSLARRATINSMIAGERIFVDLLPDTWTGPPPGLPLDVVRELAERARVAERALRQQRASTEANKRPPIRVRTSVQPTFVRFVIEMPDGVGVSSVLNEQKLTLSFNAPLKFDLADAKLASPSNIASINQKIDVDTSAIEVALIGDVDVHSFREEKNYVVDVAFQQSEKPHAMSSRESSAVQAVASAVSPNKPVKSSEGTRPSGEIAPLNSETFAQQARIEIKPEGETKADASSLEAGKSETGKPETGKPEVPKSEASKPEPGRPETAPASEAVAKPDTSARPAMSHSSEAEPKADAAKLEAVKPEAAKPELAKTEVKTETKTEGKLQPKPETHSQTESSAKPEVSAKSEVSSKPEAAMAPVLETPAGAHAQAMAAKTMTPMKLASAADELPPQASSDGAASVVARRDSDGLRLMFSFAAATPAALFRRADTVWLVFDSTTPIDIEPIRSKGGAVIAEVTRLPLDKGQAIRIRLNRPQMPSISGDEQTGGLNWTVTFAETMLAPTQPLTALRNITDPLLANVTVPLAKPGHLHRLVDPDAGDALMVITAPAPVRGFIKRQDFVEFSLLESIHGVAARPNSDDVTAEIATDKIIFGRPGGLTLSSTVIGSQRAAAAARPIFDPGDWSKNKKGNFLERYKELLKAITDVDSDQRTSGRVDLARFYLAREMYPEAKGVLDVVLADSDPGMEDTVALIVHSVASTMMDRPAQALKDLSNPNIGTNYDSQLWKALAYTRQKKWAEAREKFKNVEFAITSLPIDLQRIVISEAMRASLEAKDYSGAAKRDSDLEVVGVSPELMPAVAVLRGRLAEALGHEKDALDQYKKAIDSPDRAAAADAKLLQITLLQKRDEISQADALRDLETLSVTWRGETLEVKALEKMSRIYADTGRYSEALSAIRTATRMQPNSDVARRGQDMAGELFTQLFLGTKGDDLQPIDALGLFYEYRELTPIGRRGDEMIRKLADRLVAVDLLDQASDLLQYQVDHRLEGAARAQVAARLAMVYLTNRRPDRAIAALRTTRIADLSGELRQQRLLLEARAQSDVGRHDLALDIIANIVGREAMRLRSDIYWASRQWRESSEQIELYYGDRWRDFKPLNPAEKGDIIRAVVGYSLAEDAIGLARFREKYAPLMSGDGDRVAFETASKPSSGGNAEFGQIAKMAASVDTLEGFLREMKVRFPDAATRAALPEAAKADPNATGSLPQIKGTRQADAAR